MNHDSIKGKNAAPPRRKERATIMFSKQRRITFRIDICVEEDGDAYHAYCPALTGVHIDGETREKALENAKTAIELYITSLIKHQ